MVVMALSCFRESMRIMNMGYIHARLRKMKYTDSMRFGCLFTLLHYCCTSFERVALSCIMEMSMTSMQNSAAFAWP
jgi:hypothetical protein